MNLQKWCVYYPSSSRRLVISSRRRNDRRGLLARPRSLRARGGRNRPRYAPRVCRRSENADTGDYTLLRVPATRSGPSTPPRTQTRASSRARVPAARPRERKTRAQSPSFRPSRPPTQRDAGAGDYALLRVPAARPPVPPHPGNANEGAIALVSLPTSGDAARTRTRAITPSSASSPLAPRSLHTPGTQTRAQSPSSHSPRPATQRGRGRGRLRPPPRPRRSPPGCSTPRECRRGRNWPSSHSPRPATQRGRGRGRLRPPPRPRRSHREVSTPQTRAQLALVACPRFPRSSPRPEDADEAAKGRRRASPLAPCSPRRSGVVFAPWERRRGRKWPSSRVPAPPVLSTLRGRRRGRKGPSLRAPAPPAVSPRRRRCLHAPRMQTRAQRALVVCPCSPRRLPAPAPPSPSPGDADEGANGRPTRATSVRVVSSEHTPKTERTSGRLAPRPRASSAHPRTHRRAARPPPRSLGLSSACVEGAHLDWEGA
ncbi:hypothetical protein B0H17DRAFT_700065 [Mycena rosella]|uniref:Uncharacterized protein n=1 Tax=Mycena rosella TaxID=1033263 RepID=A0AAD7GGM5_MYCRO|nr:hypothetical protein B0H17DRAFT_700065 [Mycena rosella]